MGRLRTRTVTGSLDVKAALLKQFGTLRRAWSILKLEERGVQYKDLWAYFEDGTTEDHEQTILRACANYDDAPRITLLPVSIRKKLG